MEYRKIRAERIFDGLRFREEQVLVVDADGAVLDLLPDSEAGEGVETVTGILSPGLVNCHCHLELSHMKGLIPEGTGLVDFVFKVVTERHFSDEEILAAIEKAETEMRSSGIVAVGDICNNALTIHQKKKGRLAYYNFIEASGWLPSLSAARFERAKKLSEEFSVLKWPWSIVPHAPYSVSEELWQRLLPFFENRVVSIHNQETPHENEFFMKGTGDLERMYGLMKIDNSHHRPTGLSSLGSCIDHLNGASNAILVHNTFTTQADVERVRTRSGSPAPPAFFCLCLNANLYIENAVPDVEMLRRNECSIVLGTDSLASNWSLNLMDEIKTARSHFPDISLEELLRWATSNGAKALRMEDRLGSFEKGKRPGIVLIDEKTFSAERLA